MPCDWVFLGIVLAVIIGFATSFIEIILASHYLGTDACTINAKMFTNVYIYLLVSGIGLLVVMTIILIELLLAACCNYEDRDEFSCFNISLGITTILHLLWVISFTTELAAGARADCNPIELSRFIHTIAILKTVITINSIIALIAYGITE